MNLLKGIRKCGWWRSKSTTSLENCFVLSISSWVRSLKKRKAPYTSGFHPLCVVTTCRALLKSQRLACLPQSHSHHKHRHLVVGSLPVVLIQAQGTILGSEAANGGGERHMCHHHLKTGTISINPVHYTYVNETDDTDLDASSTYEHSYLFYLFIWS